MSWDKQHEQRMRDLDVLVWKIVSKDMVKESETLEKLKQEIVVLREENEKLRFRIELRYKRRAYDVSFSYVCGMFTAYFLIGIAYIVKFLVYG